MRDPLVLPAKYLCPRSGVSLGDLALPGVERKRGCEKSEGGDRIRRSKMKLGTHGRGGRQWDFRPHPLPPTLTREQDRKSSGLSWMGSTGCSPLSALPMPLADLPAARKTPSGAQDSPASTYSAFFTTAGFWQRVSQRSWRRRGSAGGARAGLPQRELVAPKKCGWNRGNQAPTDGAVCWPP